MTTPASFNTPDHIIQCAMQDAMLLQDGDEPSSEQYAKYMRRLADIINLFTTRGIKLWTEIDQSITLVAGTSTYTLGPSGTVNMVKPLRATAAYFLDSAANKTPLMLLSRDEYTRLSQITQQGSLNSFFVDKQQTLLSISFWMTPDTTAATGSAHVIIQQQITNPTMINETMNFPQEWALPLRWSLAHDISTGQPQPIVDRCAQMADFYRSALEDWDVEDASTRFTPNLVNGNGTGRFR